MSGATRAVWLLVLAGPAAVPAAGEEPETRPADPWARKLRRVRLLGDASFRHGGTITSIAPVPGGERILTAAADGTARLWDRRTGGELRRFSPPGAHYVWNVQLLPSGREILTAGGNESVLRWDLRTGEVLKRYPHEAMIYRLALAPGGKRFAAVDGESRCILWDLASGERVRTFTGHTSDVYTARFIDGGQGLITGSGDETVRFWAVHSAEEKRRIKSELGDITTLSLSPDGTKVLVCCGKKDVWIMDAASGKSLWQVDLPKSPTSGDWSPDGRSVVVVCYDETIYALSARDGEQRWRAELPPGTHWAVAYGGDGAEVLCGVEHLLARYDARTGKRTFPRAETKALYMGASFVRPVPNSSLVLEAGTAEGVRVWDRKTGKMQRVLLPEARVNELAVPPDGGRALICLEDGVPHLVDVRSGRLVRKFPHQNVDAAAFTRDGKALVTLGEDRRIVSWSMATGEPLRSFGGPDYYGADFALSPDDSLVACRSRQSLVVYDLASGKTVRTIPLQEEQSLGYCTFGPDAAGSLAVVIDGRLEYRCTPGSEGSGTGPGEIRRLIAQLGAGAYRRRKRATRRLIEIGSPALGLLSAADTSNPEVEARVQGIRLAIRKKMSTYEKTSTLDMEAKCRMVRFHPDGRHWAAICGEYAGVRLVIGELRGRRLKVLRTLVDPNLPECLWFDAQGRLYVGNANSTISVYAAGQGASTARSASSGP